MNSILDQIDDQPPSEAGASKPTNWSQFQGLIFDAAETTTDNLLIEAVAGSGKTTTLKELTRRLRGSTLSVAFNKAICETMVSKGFQGEVKTFNGLGHGLMLRNRPGAKLNARKVSEIIKKIMGDSTEFREVGYSLSRAVGLAKNLSFGLSAGMLVAEDFTAIIDDFGFDIAAEYLDTASTICREAFELSRLDEQTFDFDDQLWVPISQGWEFPQFDNLLVDEDQDLNPIQHLMIEQMDSRLIAVGDRHQAIYGFRGACADSTDALKLKFQMKELPLSICYRCSQEVVLAAREFCDEIQWRQDAPLGVVTSASSDPELFTQKHMILCRTNAPLFRAILAKIRAKEPCQVLSSFLDTFQSFIRGFKTKYTSDLMVKIDRWYEKEREAAKTRSKLVVLRDKYDTVKMLAAEYQWTDDILALLNRLKDSRSGPIFATIHKAKGLEYEHVYILRPELLGGFGEMTPKQKRQESNLHYVAITRAQESLTYGARR